MPKLADLTTEEFKRSSYKGIDEKEAKRLVRRFTKLANDKIDIPYLLEMAEQIAIKFVIGMVVKAARKTYSFAKLRADAKSFNAPESCDDIEMLVAG